MIQLPSEYTELSSEEIEYDGGFMSGWSTVDKVFGWIGIIAGASLVIGALSYGGYKLANRGPVKDPLADELAYANSNKLTPYNGGKLCGMSGYAGPSGNAYIGPSIDQLPDGWRMLSAIRH